MNMPLLTGRTFIMAIFISFFALCVLFFSEFINASTSKVVFCDVGQGNGGYIRLRSGIDILIDTGPLNGRILACLGNHMPFYDRIIEYVVLSHPQSDHDGGLPEILRRYDVREIIVSDTFRSYDSIRQLEKSRPKATIAFVRQNAYLDFPDNMKIIFLADVNIKKNDNDRSLVVLFATPKHQYLFTGDISSTILSLLPIPESTLPLIMEIPHHGSKYGVSEAFFKRIRPAAVVISVGKNSYGHPAKQTLHLLEKYGVPVFRTDVKGDIIFQE